MESLSNESCKSPCDWDRGTLKRLTANASLQHWLDNQILTAEAMYQFRKRNIQGITFLHLMRAEFSDVKKNLTGRFVLAKSIPHTCRFHQFTPPSQRSIVAKRVSVEADYTVSFNSFLSSKNEIFNIKPG